MSNISKRHGGPWDRGSADAYYRRPCRPHYFAGATYSSREFSESEMSQQEIAEYKAGYDYQVSTGEFKDYG